MSITPTSDMVVEPRRVGPPVRLTPDAGPQAGLIEHRESGTLYGAARPGATGAGEEESLSFWDVLDVVNPLQHIPIVSTIYRELTGDEIRAPAKVAGGALYGGVIGLAASAADALLKEVSGRDAGEHVVALFTDEDGAEGGEAPTMMAAAPAEPAAAGPGATVTAANTRWFPVNRERDTRVIDTPRDPVAEAAPQHARPPAVQVVSPRPADAPPAETPAASLPLGVLSAAGAMAAPAAAPQGPSPEAVRRAMAAQGLAPTADHPLLRTAAAGAPAPAPARPQPAAGAASAPDMPASGGPVEVPAWFDRAMMRAAQTYKSSDRLAPDDL